MQSPKTVTLDLETSPSGAWFYGSWWEPTMVSQRERSQILSMAYKIGDGKTKYIAQNMYPEYIPGQIDDKALVMEICEILKDADYLVGHNIDLFDLPMLRERIIFHRLPPLPEIPTYDTKKLIKTTSRLPSNKLDHVTDFLGNGGKLDHTTNLFVGCMNGDEKAWKMNEKYNKQDVEITYKDFIDMLPYIKLTPKQTAFSEDIQCSNPDCLSHNLTRSKNRKVVGGWNVQYQCKDCGRYTTKKKLVKINI